MANIPIVLTRKEAQELLKISKTKLLQLIREGKIEACCYGNGYRITIDAINEFLEKSLYAGAM